MSMAAAHDLASRPRPEPRSAPLVPSACHIGRTTTVLSGQPRSLRGGRWAGRSPLTWGSVGGRNCMACKGSGVQIPSAPPALTTFPPRAVVREIGELLVVTAFKHRISIDCLRLRWDDGRSAPPSRLLPRLQQCFSTNCQNRSSLRHT
jgi:hypothetical protein